MSPPGSDLKAIFSEALEHAAGPDSSAYLDRACREDAAMRLLVESLLQAHDEAGGFLGSAAPSPGGGRGVDESPTSEPADASDDADRLPETEPDSTVSVHRPAISEGPGATIGPYRLLQKIGEGGMGAVFMAEQAHPVRRKVALKVIKPGMDTAQVIARFEAERQALAMMDHPNIARVLDVGATDAGRPFFVMELVKGVPITEYCDRNHLSPKERLELFIPVCQAIQHAHQKGVIHRDVKPSNVLVTLHDGKAVPKVIDFGVAKAIDQRLTERTIFTEFGAVIGTLEYMSPEQAEFGVLDVDTRSDVYSLGVLLYELLTGSTPLERAKLRQAAYAEILRRIREEEPAKPSTRLSESRDALPTISAQRKMEPARLTKLVRGDLDWIVMKSLEKDRTRRYETAAGFAREVRRHLDGDPVEACPPSASYRFRKFARKHRAGLATAGAFALLLVAATAVSVGLALWADRQRVRAVKAEAAAKAQRGRALEREQMAIDAVKRFGDVVRETPELKNDPALSGLRATLLKEPRAFFERLRDRLQSDRETTPDSLARLATASFDLGSLTAEIGDKQEALRAYEESLTIRERLAREQPATARFQRELAASRRNIGLLQSEMGRPAEALASIERARAIFERLASDQPSAIPFQRDLASTYHELGVVQRESGRPVEALASLDRARAIFERLAREDPSASEFQAALAQSHNNIGNLERATGRPAEALAAHGKALAIFERLAREAPSVIQFQRDLAASHNNIGGLQSEAGRPKEGQASFERARAIWERLGRGNPSVVEFHVEVAKCHHDLGVLQSSTGRPAEALAAHERARAIFERLAREDPSVVQFQRGLATSCNSIGLLQRESGRPAEALAAHERARAIFERLAREDPSAVEFRRGLAMSCNNIGLVHRESGRSAEELASYERALALDEGLAREHPESPDIASNLGGTLSNMALIDLDRRQFGEARAKLARAVEWQKKALATNPDHPTYRRFLANHLTNLAQAAEGLGLTAEAAVARRELAEREPGDPAKAAVDAWLAAVLRGTEKPKDDVERIRLAYRANERALHQAAARFFAEALANEPKLAEDRQAQHRYNAACVAALAASGGGKDEPPPDDGAKAKLRRQARDWLKAELAAWNRVAMTAGPGNKEIVARTLAHWKVDADLVGIRDEKELARLPAEERAEFQRLWTDVDGLLTRATRRK